MYKDLLEQLINYSISNPEERIIKEVNVEGAQGRYFITTSGKALSLCGNRIVELQPNDNGKGYKYITICGKNYYIHQLVACAFIKDYDSTEKQIHHLDRNKDNNELSNLLPLSPTQHQLIHKYLNKWENAENKEE